MHRSEKARSEHEILQAFRPCKLWKPPASARKTRKNESTEKLSAFVQALAEAVTGEHHEASLSLVVCNTVTVAQRVYAAIRDTYIGVSDVVLLTSRFRARDREENQGRLLAFEAARKRTVTDGTASVTGLICVSYASDRGGHGRIGAAVVVGSRPLAVGNSASRAPESGWTAERRCPGLFLGRTGEAETGCTVHWPLIGRIL